MIQAYADPVDPFENPLYYRGRIVRRNWRGKEMWRRQLLKEHHSKYEALHEAYAHAQRCAGLWEKAVETVYV